MDDLISRRAAIDAVHENYDKILDFISDGKTIASSVEDIICDLPSAQPERKKGKWIKLYAGNYKCSVCGDWWANDDNEMVEDFKFCPNCGADMREDE